MDSKSTCHGAWDAGLVERLRKLEPRNSGYGAIADEAAAEIERLGRAISDGSTWISVKERLPGDEEGQVLAVNSAGFYACVNTIYQNTDGKYDGEDATPEETIDLIGDITHWMPIPEGPK